MNNSSYYNQDRIRWNVAEAVWQGIAGYINYKLNVKWRTTYEEKFFLIEMVIALE
ncbi:hypothetical protein LDG_7263 [Legionella drancourtii LLAP12]|uniref:Uncharacterized protein n=1 Tax=Legionella drancourtii LLAP12 TaxID=658187 RepID=G9EPS4_9GAMM|nr:hypothetical protein LDG_7263 [Legionella drancourtii LLAP12]